MEIETWQDDIRCWIQRCRYQAPNLAESVIRFFERTFEHTQCPRRSWFGIHTSTISLVVGGIWLAAVMKSGRDKGVWLLVAQRPPTVEGIEYRPVQSTQASPSPLMWAHAPLLEAASALAAHDDIWNSYATASEQIFDSPRISSDRDAVQVRRKKKRLSEFWQVDSPSEKGGFPETLYIRIFSGLIYDEDIRKEPDRLRKGQFKAGWEDATLKEKVYTSRTLKQLTWRNLGYRFGRELDRKSSDEIAAIYDFLSHRCTLDQARNNHLFPDEAGTSQVFYEGAVRQVRVNAYERNPRARAECIAYYGTSCVVCGFNFGAIYGEVGEGLIHVHHLRSLAQIGEKYEVDPIVDLRPVCPNCHALIHRRSPPHTIEDVQRFLNRNRFSTTQEGI